MCPILCKSASNWAILHLLTQPPGATESGGATATGGSGRGGGANAAESAGAAGSGGLSPTRKPERQRDRRDREREAVPSAGWREVAEAMGVEEGMGRE